jgi:hypothetical protein
MCLSFIVCLLAIPVEAACDPDLPSQESRAAPSHHQIPFDTAWGDGQEEEKIIVCLSRSTNRYR